jgi:organic radical activating enzyme
MSRIVLDLVEQVARLPAGDTVEVPIGPADPAVVAAWCARTGNELGAVRGAVAVVRRGRDQAGVLPVPRLWLYTNFDCNLACDYCCARSSPQAARRALGHDQIQRIVSEATGLGVAELYLTGGEPFLLLDLDEIVATCVQRLPTTLLTNGMLFRGRRLSMLRRMPREDFALQISLDSPTPERHDRHRGAGSWARAVHGIRTALAEGFRVRIAATVAAAERDNHEEAALRAFLDDLRIPRDDQLIRPIARRGFAADGVIVTPESTIPEVTITADGVYWHPVGADHLDQLVTPEILPLAAAFDQVKRRYAGHLRSATTAAQRFPCA